MEQVRSITAYSFFGAGILHLGYVIFSPFESTQLITLLFGFAYLVLGYLLLTGRVSVLAAGAVTLLGTLLNIVGMATKFNVMGVVFLVFDIAILTGCGYLLVKARTLPRRAKI